jgi:MerR family mercuric resistance operon transcriptional regulator
MEQRITIGKVAAAVGVNVETIRFYHRRGLLAEPDKEAGGFRYYDAAAIARLRFIKRAQAIGFSLDEIMGLMALNHPGCCKQAHDTAVAKLTLIEARIDDLIRIRKTLKQLVRECEVGESNNDVSCPIIATLGNP